MYIRVIVMLERTVDNRDIKIITRRYRIFQVPVEVKFSIDENFRMVILKILRDKITRVLIYIYV